MNKHNPLVRSSSESYLNVYEKVIIELVKMRNNIKLQKNGEEV